MNQLIDHVKVYAPGLFLSHVVYFIDDANRLITYKAKSKPLPVLNGRNVSRRCAAGTLRAIKYARKANRTRANT